MPLLRPKCCNTPKAMKSPKALLFGHKATKPVKKKTRAQIEKLCLMMDRISGSAANCVMKSSAGMNSIV